MAAEGGAALFTVLGKLEGVRRSGTGYEARCPAHEDRHASLSVGTGDDGRVLLDCKKGCQTEQVLASLAMDWSALFEKSRDGNVVRRYRFPGTSIVHIREELPGGKKDIKWEHNGKRGLNGTATADVPLYLAHTVAQRPGEPVIVCEGEKAAQALADRGVLAVGTVTGAKGTPSDNVLSVLQGREVWLWPDNEDVGHEHMGRIASRITPTPLWVVWEDAPPSGDAADYLEAGGLPEALQSMVRKSWPVVARSGPRIWRGDELARARFDPVRWAIPGILPSGLTILAGRPKLGKSWLCLGWVLDVASGSPVLRKVEVEQGDALYLALEDNERRMQERQAMMLGDHHAPHDLHIANEWPRQNEGGLEAIEEWIASNSKARLVVIDTFKKFRPKEAKSQRLYDLDYDAVAPVAALAQRCNVAIVVVFHTNKLDPADPIDLVSGTLGLSGAADGVLVLKRERGQADASLFVTGRDVEEQDLALKWEREDTLGWALLGQADQFRLTRERQQIIDVVKSVPGMKPVEIAAAIGKSAANVRQLLFKMTNDGTVRVRDGVYFPSTTDNGDNAANGDTTNHAMTPGPLVPAITGNAVIGVTAVTPVTTVIGVIGNDMVKCRFCGLENPRGEECACGRR